MTERKIEGRKEKYKIPVMALFLASACVLTYYFHVVRGIDVVFSHFFYIPIILAALWWRRKGVVVAIFLALLLIFSHFFARLDAEIVADLMRSFMFISIAVVTAILRERIAIAEGALREMNGKLEKRVEERTTELKEANEELKQEITACALTEKRIKHSNSVLNAIVSVNLLISAEKDRDSLLQKACDALKETRSYDVAWLVMSDGKNYSMVKSYGLDGNVSRFCERVMSSDYPPCIKKARAHKDMFMAVDKFEDCRDCCFKNAYCDKDIAIIRVEHDGKLFGLLALALASDVAADDEEEKKLLKGVAGDIALALHDMEMEEERERVNKKLKQTALLLEEHVEKLEESKRQIEEACSLREHFLKETSHRIITPVAIIGGCAQLLLESDNLDEDQKKKMQAIRERNKDIQKLVKDALAGNYLEDVEYCGG
jgi:K+-sensing histidine kinase KdpD